jgi:putative two-component system response regulator
MVGRIVALCDVFDALTSERPYKEAWAIEDVMAEIESQAGAHFDPHLVEVFKRILPDLLEIREHYSDDAPPEANHLSLPTHHAPLVPQQDTHLPPYFQPQP